MRRGRRPPPAPRFLARPRNPPVSRNPRSQIAVPPASMEAPPQGGLAMGTFWDTWRKDITRGGVLFAAVLAIGFCVHYVIARVRERVPVALRELRGNFAPDVTAGPRTPGETWSYRAKIAPNQWVWIHNTNGSVTVEPGKGDSLDVTAVKSYRRSDPASVRLVAVPFTVRLPRRVRLGATTVNGGVQVRGATAPVVAATVSGDVDAETADGPVSAVSVNGSVRARMRAFADTGEVSLFTVNGTATAELPARLDADVEASTVNGSINTDYPLTVTGKYMSHHLRGTVGNGGRRVHITTVNGSINLKQAGTESPGR